MFGNFINTANISGSNCDHKSCVEDELLSNCDTKVSVDDETNSNCDTKEKVDDETNSNCDTCLVEDESVRLGGKNSISLDFANHDHMCQPFCLENDFCDIDSVQDSTFEDMMSCSNSNKPSEFQKISSILSDRLGYVVENMPTYIAFTPSQGYHFKKWKAKEALCDTSNCNTPCRNNNNKYYGIQHGLKKDFDPHFDISATYLWSQDDAESQSIKTWFDMGIFPFDGRTATYGYLVDKTPHYTLLQVHPKPC